MVNWIHASIQLLDFYPVLYWWLFICSQNLIAFFFLFFLNNQWDWEHWPCQKTNFILLFARAASELNNNKKHRETRNQKYMFMKVKSKTCILYCDLLYYFRPLLTLKIFFPFFQFQRWFWVTEIFFFYVLQEIFN